MSHTSPTALIILDGFGISCEKKYNAIYQAKTPHLDHWQSQYFYTTLGADGLFVGLPQGYNGNSEVGHFTLGAGRIIQQSSTLLNKNLELHKLYENSTLTNFLKNFNQANRIHVIGMASDGNIHSNLDHAKNIISTLAHHKISQVLVHAFLDGRDVAPQSALTYLSLLQEHLNELACGQIASIHGRYYAMDRNENWNRTEKSFDVLTTQQTTWTPYETCIKNYYEQKIFDEFIPPTACIKEHTIQPGDGIIFFNFRPDRAIQLTKKLLSLPSTFFLTPVIYHQSLTTTPFIQAVRADNTLLEKIAAENKRIFTIAETEKYAHVTYFFNGHKDITFPQETRILIPSDKTLQPYEQPCMQAETITTTVLQSLKKDPQDFYLINFANADMVGHSGNLPATIQAIECLDQQLEKLYQEIVVQQNGTLYITADHGNAEIMFDEKTQQPCTSHSSNPVPLYVITNDQTKIVQAKNHPLNGLADIAQLILKNMA